MEVLTKQNEKSVVCVYKNIYIYIYLFFMCMYTHVYCVPRFMQITLYVFFEFTDLNFIYQILVKNILKIFKIYIKNSNLN